MSNQKTKTHEEFMEEVNFKNPNINNILIVGRYINKRTKIECKCLLDNYEWSPLPQSLLNGKGCFECEKRRRSKSHEKFVSQLYDLNKNIKVVGRYKNTHTNIEVKCLIDNHIWNPTPNNLLQLGYCPKCFREEQSRIQTKSHKTFIKELNIINNNIIVLGKYTDAKIPIKCKCLIDNHIWYPVPSSLLSEHGCPICADKIRAEKRTKTHDQFIRELAEINPNIKVLGIYVNNELKIECQCLIDNNIWGTTTPNSLLQGTGCPECNKSKGEKECKRVFNLRSVYYIPQMKFEGLVGLGNGLLSYDFYLPKYNLLIEYQGEFHDGTAYQQSEEDFVKQQEHDKRKKKYALKNGYNFLEIWYWEFDHIESILKKELNL